MTQKNQNKQGERWGIVVGGIDVIAKKILWGTINQHYLFSGKPFKGVNRIIAFTTQQAAQNWLDEVVSPGLVFGNEGMVIKMPDKGTYSILG